MHSPLSTRNRQPELMDQPGLTTDEHHRALAGLARINWLSGSSRILWPPLSKLARLNAGKTIRVLDVACGGGDVTLALARRAARSGQRMEFVGCDASGVAVGMAKRNARRLGLAVEFFQTDVLQEELPAGFDAIVCSLFLHHLDSAAAKELLRRMADRARRLVLVNDLVRSRYGYFLASAACRLLTSSRIVRVDGPLSVRGAFTPEEALALAHRAGLAGATVQRRWPERFLLEWWKASAPDGA
jgi:2-polyprenyl-3-methyl-5-hydroxy-6-metoxy-1,4-benzoquinol methylase